MPALLRGGGRKRSADLAVQCSARPKPTHLVKEIGHLRRQPADPDAGINDDRVAGGAVIDLRNGSCLIDFVVRLSRDLFGYRPRRA